MTPCSGIRRVDRHHPTLQDYTQVFATKRLQSYRATLLTADDQRIWSASNLQPNTREGLALSLNSNLIKPGTYQLTFEGVTSRGRYVPVAKYPFRAIRE